MINILKRTWADISLDNIRNNYAVVKSLLRGKTELMAVVKADAYGHGVQYVARELDILGADRFAVSNIAEAIQLRKLGITKPILILSFTPPEAFPLLAEYDVSQTIYEYNCAKTLIDCALQTGDKIKAHIKIDTGMNRIGFVHHGFSDGTAAEQIAELFDSGCLIPEGIFTHFSVSDLDGDKKGEFTRLQYDLLLDVIDKLKKKGIEFQLRHCCNSAATLNNPEMHLDVVRPGLVLYGMYPSPHFTGKFGLKPAMSLHSVVTMVKNIYTKDSVSYGRTFQADKPMRVATIPVGYADGYPRRLSNSGYVVINNRRAEIIGRICMDQLVVDVSDIDGVQPGTPVILFGSELLTIDDFSKLCQTINYETVCNVGKRVPRYYYSGGSLVGEMNCI